MNPFWILWNPASDKPPKIKFADAEMAKAAAEAMARKHPGQTFHVMECLGAVVTNTTAWSYPYNVPF